MSTSSAATAPEAPSGAYRDDKRTCADTSMNAAMYGRSDSDIRALAHYFAQQ